MENEGTAPVMPDLSFSSEHPLLEEKGVSETLEEYYTPIPTSDDDQDRFLTQEYADREYMFMLSRGYPHD